MDPSNTDVSGEVSPDGEASEASNASINRNLLEYMSKTFNVTQRDESEEPDGSDDGSVDPDEDDDDMSVMSGSSSFSATTYETGVTDSFRTVGEETKLLQGGGGLVRRSKVMVFMGIIATAAMSALITTYLVRRDENDTYSTNLASFGQELSEKSQDRLGVIIRASEELSRRLSTRYSSQGEEFTTLPRFEVFGEETREVSEAELVMWVPKVSEDAVASWESYAQANQDWIEEGLRYEGSSVQEPGSISSELYSRNVSLAPELNEEDIFVEGLHFPVWQMSRAPRNASIVNLDLSANSVRMAHDMADVMLLREPLLSSFQDLRYLTETTVDPSEELNADEELLKELNASIDLAKFDPRTTMKQPRQSYLLHPVFADEDSYFGGNSPQDMVESRATDLGSDVVGFVMTIFPWEIIFSGIFPESIGGLIAVVEDGCGSTLSYLVNGKSAEFMGYGDMHDPRYGDFNITIENFGDLANFSAVDELHPEIEGVSYEERYAGTDGGHCRFTVGIYSSKLFEDMYRSDTQSIYIAVIVVVFIIIVLLLCLYDMMVIARQRQLLHIAKQTNTLISTLFPKEIQKRILDDAARQEETRFLSADDYEKVLGDESQAQLDYHISEASKQAKAIADYFPNSTIFFADIVGFTAWSSTRDPTQVFELLETLYHAFDQLAKKRRVFKVETVGDCYVAATGLPEARKDHAIVMARFARDILYKFGLLVKQLEVKLGPDTGDLDLRIGLNSGPVTAGVLRGEKSRFQLFGDTVNTAARMESTGLPNCIHLSEQTASLLMKAGKHKWVKAREEKVYAKGKGDLQTYWLEYGRTTSSGGDQSHSNVADSFRSSMRSDADSSALAALADFKANPMSDKLQRLVKWNSELLAKSLQLIVARRAGTGAQVDDAREMRELENSSRTVARGGGLVSDEVVEIINLPSKNETAVLDGMPTSPDSVVLSEDVIDQLHDYVRTIAAMYREHNPFHNFEHASHVSMSTIKLLARVVAPNEEEDDGYGNLHDNTYGITSDPLTQFAAVFSALIHDVDHPGVPNSTLTKEETTLAISYKNKSVAEQNSIDLAWDLLMDPTYEDLRRVLYINKAEFHRFRKLLVNLVMATDIMDKELGAFRKARWNKVFNEDIDRSVRGSRRENQSDINRRATIVLEHLIQASDVSHTMQHWHIFVKWNERLFQEMYQAYEDGRIENDPSKNWYQGEIGFFDFYIIPLAKKLESCGVFGVSSDEYLAYAENNRNEWERKGHEQVEMYLENWRRKREAMEAMSATLSADTPPTNTAASDGNSAKGSDSFSNMVDAASQRLGSKRNNATVLETAQEESDDQSSSESRAKQKEVSRVEQAQQANERKGSFSFGSLRSSFKPPTKAPRKPALKSSQSDSTNQSGGGAKMERNEKMKE